MALYVSFPLNVIRVVVLGNVKIINYLKCVTAEFAADDRSVEVNEGSTQTALSLTVERVGGAVGVVQVMWNLTRSNGT